MEVKRYGCVTKRYPIDDGTLYICLSVGYGDGTSRHVWFTRGRWSTRFLDLCVALLLEITMVARSGLEREINGEMLRRARDGLGL